jgi:hypothetical protein
MGTLPELISPPGFRLFDKNSLNMLYLQAGSNTVISASST